MFQEQALGYVVYDGAFLEPLAAITRQLAASYSISRMMNRLQELSLNDSLTGICNRRFFEVVLEKEWERSRLHRHPLSVIRLDIDHLQAYNDQFGYAAGDEALREVARCLLDGARRSLDVVSRLTGGEFAIILSETGREGAQVVAERIRQTVADCAKLRAPLSLSIGILSLDGDEPEFSSILELSAASLVEAKKGGGDRIVHLPA